MKYIFRLFLVFIAFPTLGQSVAALPSDVVQSIEKRIKQGVNPSIVVGIVDKNGPRYFNFGLTKVNGQAVNEHSIYEIGSISKVFTAILLAKQAEDGILKIDDPIKKYLPADVKVPVRNEKEITLGNLSDHSSGLPRMPTNFAPKVPANPYADYTSQNLLDFISGYELTRDVGESYEYSNLAQGLLGYILAQNAHTTYEALMIKTIAAPLGMIETKVTLDEKMKKNLAIGHDAGVEVMNWDLGVLAGAGGIRSSTRDMLRFLAANLELTKNSIHTAMNKTHEVRHSLSEPLRLGLAWHIEAGPKGDIFVHNGGTGGYRAFAGFCKETGTGVVVLTNSTESVDDIGAHLLNPEVPLRKVSPSIANEFRKVMSAKGLDAAMARFNELKKSNPDDYNFSEDVINGLGYFYLATDTKAALAVFKRNAELYPNSFNVYDSYAEALLKDGQKDLAIENYKKSVEINPGSTGGIAALEKLGVTVDRPADAVVPVEVLDTYLGTYELKPGFTITVTREENHLFAQATAQGKFEIFPKTNTEFYYKVVNAQIIFNAGTTGAIENLTLLQGGMTILGKKIN